MKMLKTITIACCALFFSMCGEEEAEVCTPPADANAKIEITYPKGGEKFKVGETLTISFKVDASKMTLVTPMISIDGGLTPVGIPALGGVTVPKGTGFVCMDYSFKIGELPKSLVYKDNNPECIITIEQYGKSEVSASSKPFTITK